MRRHIKSTPTRLLPQGQTRNINTTFSSYNPYIVMSSYVALLSRNGQLDKACGRWPSTVVVWSAVSTGGV